MLRVAEKPTDAPQRPRSEPVTTYERGVQRYSLLACPEIGRGNYVLARRDRGELTKVLDSGRLPFSAPSLNLALIRQRGAELEANEVLVWSSTRSSH